MPLQITTEGKMPRRNRLPPEKFRQGIKQPIMKFKLFLTRNMIG